MNSHHVRLAVREPSQPSAARTTARDIADGLGFAEDDSYRTGLVASELASNLVKHTSAGGEMLLRRFSDESGGGVELLAIDRGPGMPDVDACLRDGMSTTGTLGHGLGAVRRLSDEFDLHSEPGRGTVVFSRVRARRARPPQGRVHYAGVSVPLSGESVCGDAWEVRVHEQGFVALVVDGLGHGWPASTAATSALEIFCTRAYSSGHDMLRLIHQGIAHTRGAAATIVDVRPERATALVAGIGNIASVFVSPGTSRSGVALPGILGHQARQFREFSYPWTPGTQLILHSDGLTTRWSLDGYRGLHARHPATVAAVLYRDCSRGRDDATVIVARAA